jgi:hypothetical protein
MLNGGGRLTDMGEAASTGQGILMAGMGVYQSDAHACWDE